MQQTKFFLLAIFCIILASCAERQIPERNITKAAQTKSIENQETTAEKSQAKTIPSAFKLSGAIAVNNNGKGWNAGLTWSQQAPNYYSIRLNGPLGGKTVLISKQGSTVTYQEDNKIIKARNDEELLQKKTNIHLPVNNLYYWVRGIPAPGAVTFSKKDNLNNYEIIQQNGFTIIYSQYTKNNNGVMLPRKIKITKQNLTIKVVIKDWS